LIAGRRRPLQSEQTGKSRYPGDDGQVPEAEVDGAIAATARTGIIRGRIQAVHRTGPRAVGRTVDGRAAANVRSKDDRALGVVREEAEQPAGEPIVVVVFVFSFGSTAEHQSRHRHHEQH